MVGSPQVAAVVPISGRWTRRPRGANHRRRLEAVPTSVSLRGIGLIDPVQQEGTDAQD